MKKATTLDYTSIAWGLGGVSVAVLVSAAFIVVNMPETFAPIPVNVEYREPVMDKIRAAEQLGRLAVVRYCYEHDPNAICEDWQVSIKANEHTVTIKNANFEKALDEAISRFQRVTTGVTTDAYDFTIYSSRQ